MELIICYTSNKEFYERIKNEYYLINFIHKQLFSKFNS
jgi:hypothetical protein